MVNEDGKVLLIEQKDGDIEETEDDLIAIYSDGRKSVANQVLRNLGKFRSAFCKRHPGWDIEIDYLVYLRKKTLEKPCPPRLRSGKIVNAKYRAHFPEIIAREIGSGTGLYKHLRDVVSRFCELHYGIVPDIQGSNALSSALVGTYKGRFTWLNKDLAHEIENMAASPRRVRVQGVAGSGKTGIAIWFYERAIEVGGKPLMVCFNRPLRERLKRAVRRNGQGQILTFAGLCHLFLEETDSLPNPGEYRRGQDDSGYWRDLIARVEEIVRKEPVPDKWKFDSLIIEEAQGFESQWFLTLKRFLRKNSDIL